MTEILSALTARLRAIPRACPVGRIVSINADSVRVGGLDDQARLGDIATLRRQAAAPLRGEVVRIDPDGALVLLHGTAEHLTLGGPVVIEADMGRIAPAPWWIGRIVDPFGQPLDGAPLLPGTDMRALTDLPPPAADRRPLGARLDTGLAALNTFLPIVRGQRIGLFAGSGVGKSRLLAALGSRMQADVVVVAMIGERGREVRHFADQVLGPEGMKRAIIVAATSDQSPLLRRRCAWSAMTIAEHFRDQGQNVLLLADSVTRFAEAHREIALAAGELPALRGYPASTAQMITSLCERAGPGQRGQSGDITAVFSVLVAGSDMDEPIADILRGVLDGHVVLDRTIAERGRYPAIDLLRSVSRSLPDAATATENALLADARQLVGAYERSEVMVRAGLYSEGSDPQLDRALRVQGELDAFLARVAEPDIAASFDRLSLILRRAGAATRHG